MVVLGTDEVYLLYSDLCSIPNEYNDLNVNVGNTTRSVCRRLCSTAYNMKCSAFLYDRQSRGCVLTPFTGALTEDDKELSVSVPSEGCNTSSLEFYRRIRHLGMPEFRVSIYDFDTYS